MRFGLKTAAVCAALMGAGAAQAATLTETSGPFGFVTDNTAVTRSVMVTLNEVITDVNVKIFDLNSTWVGDLILQLVSPSGTAVDLICRSGRDTCRADGGFGDSSDLAGNYLFDDDADQNFSVAVGLLSGGQTLSDSVAYTDEGNGGLNDGLLAAFNGEFSAGEWRLTLSDNAGGDQTSAGAFELTIETAAVPLPASLPLLMAGVAALGLRRKRG